jgi:hypothetical protein
MGLGLNDSDTPAAAARGRIRLLVLASLVCAFQFYINLPVLDHEWVYFDDDINIVLNPHLTGTSDTLKWAWSDASYNRRYMPIGWMLFDGIFRAGGLNPVLYHAVAWLLAAANSVVLFLIARRFIVHRSSAPYPTAWQDLSAALVVGFFSVHPLRAETAGWASALLYQGSTLLASLAVLASFLLRAAAIRSAAEWLGRLLFVLSLLLYPVQVGLPLLLIVAACCAPSVTNRTELVAALRLAIRRYASWLALVLIVGALNIFAASSSSTFSSPGGLGGYSLGTRLLHSASMLGHYVAQTVWPASTSPFYGDLGTLPVTHRYLLPLSVLGSWLFLIVWPRTRFAAALLLAAFFAAILPFIGLLDQGQNANDRYTFLLLGAISVAAAGLLAKIPHRHGRVAAAVLCVVATALVLPAYREALAVWRTTTSLQVRVDSVMAARPEIRLAFARPAMNDFMSGRYAASQQRLRDGFARFGSNPELISAAVFIEETRTSLTRDGRNPSMPPYAFMHLDLARKHRAAGYSYAAKIHAEYASRLMAEAIEEKQP